MFTPAQLAGVASSFVSLQTTDLQMGRWCFSQWSPSKQRPVLIKIARIKLGQRDKASEIVEGHLAIAEGQKALLAQLPQHPVDMYGAQAKHISQQVLRNRTVLARLATKADKPEARAKFQKVMRHALQCVAATKVDQMLDQHRLIA